jgi:hypothetical protein
MTRFQVQHITSNKGSEHKLLSVKVLDRKTHYVYNFYIEQIASPKDSHKLRQLEGAEKHLGLIGRWIKRG